MLDHHREALKCDSAPKDYPTHHHRKPQSIPECEIRAAIAAGQFETEPWDSAKERLQGPSGRAFHVGRVAHFVQNGLPSDGHYILLDLQPQPNGREIGIVNGNHRIAAAIIRGDEHIEATLHFYEQTDISRLLPGALQS